ncbi:hypothetical protein [Enemella evansiae]|uniref:hypothetical protein n=1 Tax=Enemella evansiae TaxID=2016499 RepID=UPI000B96B33D|nr:hypothetical protein [Enemella evansiae]OYO12373.1 hypothetical protein BI335_14250 [Enemella evansiae]TDO93262.1 hypothetical protein C8D81_1042 [Enemella evansiae]
MRSEEEQLRGALHRLNEGEPEPLDADRIIAGARARQTRNRARIAGATGALAVVALAGVLLPPVLRTTTSGVSSSAPEAAPAPVPAASGAAAPQRADRPAATIADGRWCLVGAIPACQPLDQDRAEIELSGTPTLAVLAPAGTERIELVRPGGPAPRVLAAQGDDPRLIGLQPLAGRQPIQAVAADGRVLATW